MSDEKCPECNGFRALPRMVGVEAEDRRECTNQFHKETPVAVAEPEPPPVPAELPAPEIAPPSKWSPVCPHCSHEGKFQTKRTAFGPYQVLAICCGECHKVISFIQPLDLQLQNMPMPPMPGGPGN